MSDSTKGITMTIYRFHDNIFLRSPKGTHSLNPMRYHGTYLENTYCHLPYLGNPKFIYSRFNLGLSQGGASQTFPMMAPVFGFVMRQVATVLCMLGTSVWTLSTKGYLLTTPILPLGMFLV